MTSRQNPNSLNHRDNPAFHAGYEAKMREITEIGWEAARDEFNRVHPPGKAGNYSIDGLAYGHGECQALCDNMDRRVA